ncbi:MAG: glucodextranase DOMON-like domain-containing protein [Myxococcota bacterium]
MLIDPTRDDYGPGAYVYPQGSVYRQGALDLQAVTLSRRGDWVHVEARFAGQVAVARDVHLAREQVEDLFIATVDVYLDLERGDESGFAEALPGRNVQLAGGARWDVAVVLSPIPSRLKEALAGHPAGGALFIPRRVRVRQNSLHARFPVGALRGAALEQVGVAVAVTGTVFSSTFRSGLDGMIPTAFVREVTAKPGRCDRWEEALDGAPCTFGGCSACEGHPRVLDALCSEPGVQERSLRRGTGEGSAVLPMNWGLKAPPPVALLDDRDGSEALVVDRNEDLVTLQAGAGGLPELGVLLEGYDARGRVVATLVMGKQLVASGAQVGVAERVSGALQGMVLVRWRANAE